MRALLLCNAAQAVVGMKHEVVALKVPAGEHTATTKLVQRLGLLVASLDAIALEHDLDVLLSECLRNDQTNEMCRASAAPKA